MQASGVVNYLFASELVCAMSSDQTGSKVNHKDEERTAQTLLPADRWVVTSNNYVI
jgi:hypothetical protein